MVDLGHYIVSQLPYLVPMLLTYGVGIVLAAVRLRRLGKPAALALAGCALLFVNTLVFAVVQGYLFTQLRTGATAGNFATTMMIVSVAGSALYIVGFGLMLAAVFSGRRASYTRGFDVEFDAPAGLR